MDQYSNLFGICGRRCQEKKAKAESDTGFKNAMTNYLNTIATNKAASGQAAQAATGSKTTTIALVAGLIVVAGLGTWLFLRRKK